jgi:hypothetical protein
MVNLIKIHPEQVVEEIVEPNYFSLYELNGVMFESHDNDLEDYYEMYRPLLPYELDGHLYYPSDRNRQSFCRLLWDRHCHFSVVRDFSYRNWIFYILADVNWSICDDQVDQIWQRIDAMPEQRLPGMRNRWYYSN